MAEPAWKMPRGERDEPDDESSGVVLLQRWVKRPDGGRELLEIPLTREDFLDPQIGDQWVQGAAHSRARRYFADLLDRHLGTDDDAVVVLDDVKHLFGPGFPGPAPDVSVIRGARGSVWESPSFDAMEQGVVPCFVVEIVSPSDASIRQVDEVDKVELYARVGILEYLLVDLPRRGTGNRFRLRGLRLGPHGQYRPIEPDAEGYLFSETMGLRFGVSPQGDRVEIFDARTGERLLNSREVESARKAADARVAQEAKARKAAEARIAQEIGARKAAEAELERLQMEIERLKKSGH